MSWQDRVNDFIQLTSPSGRPFTPAWIGNKRTMEKKLGVFEYALARGVVVQDLDVGATRYPMTLYFHGIDHDIEAARFYEACKERGPWTVLHPVRGILKLQLVSVTEAIEPVTSGGVTEIETEWIEVGLDNPEASIAEITATISEAIFQTQDAAIAEFNDQVSTRTPSLLARLIATVMKVLAIVQAVTALISGVIGVVTQIRNTIMGIINAVVLTIAALASAIVTLITLPATLMKDVKSRMGYFKQILTESFKLKPSAPGSGSVNVAAVVELVAVSAATGIAQTMVDAEFGSRVEVMSYLDQMDALMIDIINNLDNMQDVHSVNAIDKQYFSQSQSFNDMMLLLTLVRRLLLARSFDLATAKYVTLRKDRAPIEIAITEGVDFDAFVAYNDLKGDEILLLTTGRKVVVYL